MKRILSLLTALTLLLGGALADYSFDVAELERTPDCLVFPDTDGVNTVVRPMNQPFMGELDEDGELIVYLDYVAMPNEDLVLLRLVVSTALPEMFAADTVSFTVGGKEYVFYAASTVDEYDRTYYEDYRICLTAESLPLLKAIAQQKKDDPIPVKLEAERTITGRVIIPGATAAYLYDRYIDLGGKKQNLKAVDDLWPVEIRNAK